MRRGNGANGQNMKPDEIILKLENALVRLDKADKSLAATKIAEAIEILKIDHVDNEVLRRSLHHDND